MVEEIRYARKMSLRGREPNLGILLISSRAIYSTENHCIVSSIVPDLSVLLIEWQFLTLIIITIVIGSIDLQFIYTNNLYFLLKKKYFNNRYQLTILRILTQR